MPEGIQNPRIKVKAMCVFVHDGKVLLQNNNTSRSTSPKRKVISGNFYRMLGGSLEFFETADQAIHREIREELGSEIENLVFFDVVQNPFIYEGEKNHEIVFIYRADLVNKELYKQDRIHVIEDGYEFYTEWVPIEKILKKEAILYPPCDQDKLLK